VQGAAGLGDGRERHRGRPGALPDVKDSRTVHRLWTGGAQGQEYFLLEHRRRTGFDSELPGEGLLVWHVDDAQEDNSDEQHHLVGLLQADGLRELEQDLNRGDGGDCYPGLERQPAAQRHDDAGVDVVRRPGHRRRRRPHRGGGRRRAGGAVGVGHGPRGRGRRGARRRASPSSPAPSSSCGRRSSACRPPSRRPAGR
jgi:hypothetical protein